MATAEQYENMLWKAEKVGVKSLTKNESEMLMRLYRESGARGNRARKLIDSK